MWTFVVTVCYNVCSRDWHAVYDSVADSFLPSVKCYMVAAVKPWLTYAWTLQCRLNSQNPMNGADGSDGLNNFVWLLALPRKGMGDNALLPRETGRGYSDFGRDPEWRQKGIPERARYAQQVFQSAQKCYLRARKIQSSLTTRGQRIYHGIIQSTLVEDCDYKEWKDTLSRSNSGNCIASEYKRGEPTLICLSLSRVSKHEGKQLTLLEDTCKF